MLGAKRFLKQNNSAYLVVCYAMRHTIYIGWLCARYVVFRPELSFWSHELSFSSLIWQWTGVFTRFRLSVIRPLRLQLPQRLRMVRISSTGWATPWREAISWCLYIVATVSQQFLFKVKKCRTLRAPSSEYMVSIVTWQISMNGNCQQLLLLSNL